MRHIRVLFVALITLWSASFRLHAQTVIFSDPGATYSNTDSMTTNTYGPVSVSSCSSVSVSLNYNFSLPFSGAGHMESSDECPFGVPPCAGDPTMPDEGGCAQCWDFLYVQFQVNGTTVDTRLIGVPGSLAQSGTLTYGPVCTNGAGTVGLIVQTQTWAANESVTFSNIAVTCWDGSSTVSANPNPVCSGQSFNLQATLSNPPSVGSTLWTGPGNIANPTQLNTQVNNAPAGTNTYTFTATDDNACTTTSTVDVTVNQGPTMQDPPNITVCGQNLVEVNFTPVTGNPEYTWTNSNTAIGLDASGTGNISFTPAPVTNSTTATVTVTPSENGCVGPAQTFTITVNPAPTVNQPNDVTVCGGTIVNVNLSGSQGAALQWTNDNTNIGLGASGTGNINFVALNGINTEIASITVTPVLNGCSGTPAIFNVTVNPTPAVTDPPNQIVCSGDQVQVLFSGTGNNPIYTWTNTNTGIGLASNGSGDISFTAAPVGAVTTGTIQVTPSENGCVGQNQNFTITVNPVPTVDQPANITVCKGAQVNVSFVGSNNPVFNWINDNSNIGLGASGTGDISFTASQVSSIQTANITVTPTAGICAGEPVVFTITVTPGPSVNTIPDVTVCSGAPVSVNFTSTGNNPSFAWTNNNTAIGLGSSGSGNISFTAATVNNSITGNLTVAATENGCTGPASNFNITVTPAPTMNQPQNVTACAGTPVNVQFSGSSGATFNWTNSNTTIGLPASGTGNISFTPALNGTQQVATITATPVIGTCSGASVSFTITINPTPTVADPANQTVCGGTPVQVIFSGSGNPVFSWTNNNTAIGLGTSGTGDISFTSAGVSNPVTGTITVTPAANGCTGTSQDFDITIIPAPTVNNPGNTLACAGTPVNITFSGTGNAYSWTNNNTAIGLDASGSGNISFTAAAVLSDTVANLTVIPDLNGCTGPAQSFSISVSANPTLIVLSVSCAPDALAYSIVLSTSGDVLTASDGTVSGSNGAYTVNIIPIDSSVSITAVDTISGCNCPTIQPPANPINATVCEGAAIPALSVMVAAGETADWYAAPLGGAPLLSGNTSFTPTGISAPGVYTFYAEARELSSNCVSATRTAVTLIIESRPSLVQPGNPSVCPGEAVGIILQATPGASVSWTNDNTSTGLPLSGTGNINFIAQNNGSTAITSNVTVTATTGTCVSQPKNFIITVNTIPSVNPVPNQTPCSGTTINIPLSGTAGAVFNWVNSNTNVGLGASGTGDIIFTAANTSVSEQAVVTVTPVALGCTGTPVQFNISVSPPPIVTPPLSQTVCSGTTLAVGFNGTSGAVFSWTNTNPSVGLAASGTGGFTFTATNTTQMTQVANIVVTPGLNGCSGVPQAFTITVNPRPTFTLGAVTCAPNLLTYSIAVTSNAVNLTSTAGTVTGGGGNFQIINIPAGNSVVLIASNPATGCSVQQAVNAPNCVCPPIAAPTSPNAPVICEGSPIPALTVAVAPGLTADWFSTPTGGSALLTGNTSFTPAGPLAPGSYTFYVQARDAVNNCISTTRTPVILTVNPVPTLSQPINQTVCNGFVISVGFNGTTGAAFNWTNSNPAIGLGANGTGNISFTAVNTGTAPVTATVTVTPVLGACPGAQRTFTITVNPTPQVTISGDLQICAGESTTLTASGTGSFVWNNGTTGPTITVSPAMNTNFTVTLTSAGCATLATATVKVGQSVTTTINQTTCDPTQVGSVTQNLTNSAGCDSTVTVTTTLDLANCAPTANLNNGAVSCFGGNNGALTLTAGGGQPPYLYNWTNGIQSGNGLMPIGTTQVTLQSLSAGTYQVTVSTASGQTATAVGIVSSPTQLQPLASAVTNFGQYALSCHDASDASVQAAATGGSGQYLFAWNTGANAPLLTNVGAGTYTVTVTDASQCTATASATVVPPPALSLQVTLDEVICGETVLGTAITPNGGVGPFTIAIDGMATTGGLNPELGAGTHTILLTDANNCTADTTVSVVIPVTPDVQLPAEVTVALGEKLTLDPQTNLQTWQNVMWNPLPNPACPACLRQEWIPEVPGTFTVTITDVYGCTASASVTVRLRREVDVYIPNVFSPNDDGKEDFWTISAGASVVAIHTVLIFDRWGNEVYKLEGPAAVNDWRGWDGTFRGEDMNPAVFVYYLELDLANGERVIRKGDVTIVR
jgi:gliding motility-associated-like protein